MRKKWREAKQFQEGVRRALAPLKTEFDEWLLLETLSELLAESGEGASQAQVARRAGLSQMATSRWMSLLSEWGAVDREPQWDGRGYSIFLTEMGRETLRVCNEALRAAELLGFEAVEEGLRRAEAVGGAVDAGDEEGLVGGPE